MTEISLPTTQSPFDAIRHIAEDGSERWYGRELMPVMDYSRWDKFATVINKAKASLALVQGEEAAELHFPTWGSDGGRWGAGVADFRLTRFAAYLTAMAGDDTKRAVAEARIYFAIRTREAEAAKPAQAAIPTHAEALRLAADEIEKNAALTAQLAIAAPKVAYVDQFVNGSDDTSVVNAVACQFGVTEKAFREYLVERGVLYRRVIADYINSHGKRRVEYEWLARASCRAWFTAKDQPMAPRMHNGQMRTTLYFTPVGKEGVARLVERHPIGGQA